MSEHAFLDPAVRRYLLDDEGEILVDEIPRHWATRVLPVLVILFGAAMIGTIPGLYQIWVIPALISAAAIGWGSYRLAAEHMDRFVVTNMRVYRVNGVFNRNVATVPIARILDISMTRPLIGMILGYGHFIFESAAQNQGLSAIRFVPNIQKHDKTIQTIIARSGVRARAEVDPSDFEGF